MGRAGRLHSRAYATTPSTLTTSRKCEEFEYHLLLEYRPFNQKRLHAGMDRHGVFFTPTFYSIEYTFTGVVSTCNKQAKKQTKTKLMHVLNARRTTWNRRACETLPTKNEKHQILEIDLFSSHKKIKDQKQANSHTAHTHI